MVNIEQNLKMSPTRARVENTKENEVSSEKV